MSTYRGTADPPAKAKAIAAVLGVHVVLAAVILSGLNVRMVRQAVERMQTIDIREPPPPPKPKPPPPAPKPQQMKKPAGAPAKKAEASPIVAPKPRIEVKAPIVAAQVAGRGSAATSGAGTAGTGTGAGGSGSGPGGGGFADYSRFTPARRLTKIPDREYRRLVAASGMRQGTITLSVLVNTDGTASHCRILRSTGNGHVDGLMCGLTVRYMRFSPARDPNGRPVPSDVILYPNWWKP